MECLELSQSRVASASMAGRTTCALDGARASRGLIFDSRGGDQVQGPRPVVDDRCLKESAELAGERCDPPPCRGVSDERTGPDPLSWTL
jgi:hypothetical protein